MTDVPDFEFIRRFRQLIVEQLALEAVRGGSWKRSLDDLKRNLPKILEVQQSDIEREIAHLLEVRNCDGEASERPRSLSNDNEPISLDKQRMEHIRREMHKAEFDDDISRRNKRNAESKQPGENAQAGEENQHGQAKAAAGGSYGSGVRKQVFEVVVRQGVAGAPWRRICAEPMRVNNIDPAEVQEEINRRLETLGRNPQRENPDEDDDNDDDEPPRRRRGGGGQPKSPVPKNPFPFFGGAAKTRSEPGKTRDKNATAKDFSSHEMKSHEQRSQAGDEEN